MFTAITENNHQLHCSGFRKNDSMCESLYLYQHGSSKSLATLLFISGNVHPYPGPISNHPHPRHPCSMCHLDVGRDSLQCSACLKWVHFLCFFLTRADFRTICATGTAVGWRCLACHPQWKTGSPTQTSLLVTPPASPPPPGFPPLPPGFYHSRPPRGLPRYPGSICSLEVGKDSLKCSTCSKWVHFSCSSLTRADFRKICAAGSPMGLELPCLSLMGTLSLPPTGQNPPRLVSPALPHPHALHLLDQILWIHLCLYPHILPFLTPALLPPSPFLPHHHSFTAGPQLATAPSRKSTPLTQSQNSAMECRRSFLLQPC